MRREREAQVMRTSRPVSRSASRAGTAVSAAAGGTANAPVRTAHVQVLIVHILYDIQESLNKMSLGRKRKNVNRQSISSDVPFNGS